MPCTRPSQPSAQDRSRALVLLGAASPPLHGVPLLRPQGLWCRRPHPLLAGRALGVPKVHLGALCLPTLLHWACRGPWVAIPTWLHLRPWRQLWLRWQVATLTLCLHPCWQTTLLQRAC